ncbi:MAG: helix-turn-helix domain-containing protein, partial [Alphaproteobacteria bacterium]
VRQVADLKLKTTEQRLADYLLGLIPDRKATAATVRLPYDKKILASQLGMTPESLSRAIAKLRAVGIRSLGGALIVSDVGKLRALSRESEFSD